MYFMKLEYLCLCEFHIFIRARSGSAFCKSKHKEIVNIVFENLPKIIFVFNNNCLTGEIEKFVQIGVFVCCTKNFFQIFN